MDKKMNDICQGKKDIQHFLYIECVYPFVFNLIHCSSIFWKHNYRSHVILDSRNTITQTVLTSKVSHI